MNPAICKMVLIKCAFFSCASFLFLVFACSCKDYNRNSGHKDISLSRIRKGEALAIRYCQSCHLLPDPSLLDSKSWENGVLPNMGPRLGIFQYGYKTYPSYKYDGELDPNFYPSKPVLTSDEWQSIIDYYAATSPDSLPKQHRQHSIQIGLPIFTIQQPNFSYDNATASFVKIRDADSLHPLIISDVVKKNIYFFDRQMQIKDSVHTSGPIVDVDFSQNKMWIVP